MSRDEQRRFAQIAADLGFPDVPPAPPGTPRLPRRRWLSRSRRTTRTWRREDVLAAMVVVVLAAATIVKLGWHAGTQLENQTRPLPAVAVSTHGDHHWMNTQVTGEPVTFNPCRPIHWMLNPEGMPTGGDAIVSAAVADVSARTGLKFVYDGTTTQRVSEHTRRRRGDPVVVNWATQQQEGILAGDVAGAGTPVSVELSPGIRQYVSGMVLLDSEPAARAIATRPSHNIQLVTMHELGHVLGLAHSTDPAELMASQLTNQRGWGPGDLEGLALLGQGPCR